MLTIEAHRHLGPPQSRHHVGWQRGKLRPRTFIRALFRIRGDASTPAPSGASTPAPGLANLVVVVNHTRSGHGAMKVKSKGGVMFKQDVWGDGVLFQSTICLNSDLKK